MVLRVVYDFEGDVYFKGHHTEEHHNKAAGASPHESASTRESITILTGSLAIITRESAAERGSVATRERYQTRESVAIRENVHNRRVKGISNVAWALVVGDVVCGGAGQGRAGLLRS